MPPSIRATPRGRARPVPFGKDIVLYLAGRYGAAFASDCSLEFTGPMADAMTPAARTTPAGHAVEPGATFGCGSSRQTAHGRGTRLRTDRQTDHGRRR